MNMHLGIVALALGLTVAVGAGTPPVGAANGGRASGQAQWTTDPPPDPSCGPFHTLLVQGTEADGTAQVVYQFGDTCDDSFHILQGSALATVNGNLNKLTISGAIPVQGDEGRAFLVNVTLHRTGRPGGGGAGGRTVSASASGTVILDGTDVTGGVPTSNATISTQ